MSTTTQNDIFIPVSYLRVSKPGQNDHNKEKYSIDDQKRDVLSLIRDKGWNQPLEFYIDLDSGQELGSRENFLRMMDDAAKKKFNLIIVWDANRLGRNPTESNMIQDKLLQEHGVQVYSIGQPVEPDRPDNINFNRDDRTIVQQTSAMVAKLQTNEMTRKFKRAMEGKTLNGRIPKPGTKVYGLKCGVKLVGDKAILFKETEKSEARIVKMVYEWYCHDDYGDRKIAEKLNEMKVPSTKGLLWSSTTVSNILKNPIYCGKAVWNRSKVAGYRASEVEGRKRKTIRRNIPFEDWIIVDVKNKTFNPIVSEKLFNLAREKRLQRRKIGKASYSKSLLVGIMKCKVHKCGMVAHVRQIGYKKGLSKYSCGHKHTGRVKDCPNAQITMRTIDELVIKQITELIDNDALIEKYVEKQNREVSRRIRDEIVNLEKKIEDLKKKKERIYHAYEQGSYTLEEFNIRKGEITNSLEHAINLAKEKSALLDKREKALINNRRLGEIKKYSKQLAENKTVIRGILLSVIDRIEVQQKETETEIDIFFNT